MGLEPTTPASEDSSCLRPRGHCDWFRSSLPSGPLYLCIFQEFICYTSVQPNIVMWRSSLGAVACSGVSSCPFTAAPAHVFKNTHWFLAARDIYPTDSTLIKNAIVGVNHQLSALFICTGGHHVEFCLTARYIATHLLQGLRRRFCFL
jgi:hypothetical protein